MLKFEFSDSDCKPEEDDPECQYANIVMKWRGDQGDVPTMLERFKEFMLGCGFCHSNIDRIVYLEDKEFDMLRAKGLLEEGKDDLQP
jgi:hypothetical protein